MIQLYQKIWAILSNREKKKAMLLLFLMTLMAFIEILGISSIIPFLTVLGNPEMIKSNYYLKLVYSFFEFNSENFFLIFLGLIALLSFFSAALKSLTSYAKYRFSNIRRHSIGQNCLAYI